MDKNVWSSSSPKKLAIIWVEYQYSNPDFCLFELREGRKKTASVLNGWPLSSVTNFSFSFSWNGPRTVILPCCCIFEIWKEWNSFIRMIVLWIFCLFFSGVNGIQYVEMLFSIEPINVESLFFNESWVVNYDDSLMERIELPVISLYLLDCSLSFPFMIERWNMFGFPQMDTSQ